jgi:hypothetical protein
MHSLIEVTRGIATPLKYILAIDEQGDTLLTEQVLSDLYLDEKKD